MTASSTARIVEQRLNAGDEHLLLASQGVWDVVSPDDAALRLHFHLKASVMNLHGAMACAVSHVWVVGQQHLTQVVLQSLA